ncbi:nicotinate (nicotinamide) nucleotide adenylyltransferase [Archangium violaceum]|uniref:nicotinate (nicotinamide) nucleotide adenylyltransferase n=1 Tax=Archangium violaceum TaxID=83451 RepID=UPI00194EB1AC|nr:nicotinate (nicotinamide) nucleotide adenylyltransferase [Archangium violaceum]QRN93440.1 nicotinate (nicotinamide) nucleotide adenylyltransferase [Archangium violaceum]
MRPPVQVALLGGSFNPPHVGHLMAAHYVRATQGVDEVWFMPTFRHPFGKVSEEFEHRLRMCELMCRDTSGWMKCSRVESEVGKDGRTVDTLEFLQARHPEHRYTLVIGSDILKDLPHWKDVDRIRRMARVLVLHRAGYPGVDKIIEPPLEVVGPPLAEVSSTEIRERLSRGELPSDLVPSAVLAYAREHHLYGL